MKPFPHLDTTFPVTSFSFQKVRHKTTTNVKLICYVFSARKKKGKNEKGEEVVATSRINKERSKEGERERGETRERDKEKEK